MTATTSNASGAPALPDYAPVPPSAFGPALNEQGYYVGRVERNLFWITDGTYQSAFLVTDEGVVVFDAPPTIGHNLRRAVDEVAAAEGTTNKVTHLVYSHHHADHAGAANLFGDDVSPDRSRGHSPVAASRQRPDPAGSGCHVPGHLHAEGRRRAGRAGVPRPQPLTGQHLHPLPRPRHADARRHRQLRLGAHLQPQSERGCARLHRRTGPGPGLPVEALHRRSPRPARHPRRRRAAPAIHRRHRRARRTHSAKSTPPRTSSSTDRTCGRQ